MGTSSRTAAVFSATMPILAYQRSQRGWLGARLGAASSHSATTAKMPTKKPSLIAGSFAAMKSGIRRSLRAPFARQEPIRVGRNRCRPVPTDESPPFDTPLRGYSG